MSGTVLVCMYVCMTTYYMCVLYVCMYIIITAISFSMIMSMVVSQPGQLQLASQLARHNSTTGQVVSSAISKPQQHSTTQHSDTIPWASAVLITTYAIYTVLQYIYYRTLGIYTRLDIVQSRSVDIINREAFSPWQHGWRSSPGTQHTLPWYCYRYCFVFLGEPPSTLLYSK